MLQLIHSSPASDIRRFSVGLARTEAEILEAKRLRYRVFAEEMGARLSCIAPGVDHDLYDPFCEHLIVRDEEGGRVVGTYRILTPQASRRAGNYYSEGEFDLTRLWHLRPRLVEVGRSCVDADYRSGAVIGLLWSGIAGFMRDNSYDYLMGCASVGMLDGGRNAVGIYNRLQAHMAPPEYRVFPRCRLPLERIEPNALAEPPPLLRGYLRVGACVCGEPAWDPDFNTADLLILLPMSRVSARYARRYVPARA